MPVEVVHWNPETKRWPLERKLRGSIAHKIVKHSPLRAFVKKVPVASSPVNNFGDLLGPMVVEKVRFQLGLGGGEHQSSTRLLAVGSILQLARTGDTIWGSGAMKDLQPFIGGVTDLDIRAVRGPMTRSHLIQLGHDVPEVYGDPGLLLGHLWGREHFFDNALAREFVVIPNHSELEKYSHLEECISPMAPLENVLSSIASSNLVIASSLHGLIVAESFGIPAILLAPQRISLMKFWDYYLGTGRYLPNPARSIEEALSGPTPAPLEWNPGPLLAAFPRDLWTPNSH